jgi:hypothetical protein
VTFEPGSKLSSIGNCAFGDCSSLSSICIPSSVERIGKCCFLRCTRLQLVSFESGSRLSRIGDNLFGRGLSLSSVCLPPLIQAAIHRYHALTNLTL